MINIPTFVGGRRGSCRYISRSFAMLNSTDGVGLPLSLRVISLIGGSRTLVCRWYYLDSRHKMEKTEQDLLT